MYAMTTINQMIVFKTNLQVIFALFKLYNTCMNQISSGKHALFFKIRNPGGTLLYTGWYFVNNSSLMLYLHEHPLH